MAKTVQELEAGLNFVRVGLLEITNMIDRVDDGEPILMELRDFVADLITASASEAPELEAKSIAELEAEIGRRQSMLTAALSILEAKGKEVDAMRWRLLNAADAIMLLAERAKASPQELAQLGLASYVKDAAGNAHSVFSTLDDLAEASESAMKHQATTAKFRQLKSHFVVHQRAVSMLLDQLKRVTLRNTISKEDVQKLRDLRDDLSATIRREI